ncbi:PREDICTED: leucine-rich repeat neuronal protein 4 [Galeopterus variegatus]|uniref:Leucine-rich repeat neuronal protein 4 n=1 Tax=Galeopterus variegatus TaxID=482537 RepID=A0ABM0QRQ8_GALVR|nr:PREDICTED: leucine-rich repeat neuronal protein 4 [Galeopterus variegatus]
MWRALLLLLLLPPTVLRPSRAGPPQERVPLLWLTQQSSWGSGGSNATGSPCEGLPTAGATALTLTNRSLERLPSCLPRTLSSLDGSHNLLSALSAPELGHLPQLQVLTLRHNRIAALRWGPGGPAALHTLDLSDNRLAALPPCAGTALRSLRALALAGNPLRALQPRAFACFPALQVLNLSSTELGRGGQGGIAEAAFAGAGGAPLAALEVLDLSGTFLERVESGWIRDLPKLTSLYLRKMPRLRILEGDIFKMTPNLQQLDCQDSPALTAVHTHIFQDTPCLQVLLFQNCNLSSFPPWTLNSSQVLSINLFGNPLTCSCELSWLLMDAKRAVLSRAADTVCVPAAGSRGPFSAPLSLSQLPDVCQWDQSTTLFASTPPSLPRTYHAPSAQGPSTPLGSAAFTLPAGGPPSVSTPLSLPLDSFTRAAELHGHDEAGTTPSTTNSTAGHSSSSVPPRAVSTAGTEHRGGHAAGHFHEPPISAASTPLTSKRLSPFPTSWNPVSTPQPNQRTQATPQPPHPSPSEAGIPILLLDDYREEEEEGTMEGVEAPPQDVPCDYHPCKHLQTPCAQLQRRQRCRCPGLSGEDTIPDPPKLQGVSEMTDTSVLVHWCAPNSVVHGYQIRYSAEGRAGNQSVLGGIYATARQHPLYGLSPATTYRVCVLAANRAGLSQPRASGWRSGCVVFTTKPSFVLIFAGLCAASGLLLVSTLVLAACLCRRSRSTPRRQQHDTRLVAYKNPAFDYPLKLQTCS